MATLTATLTLTSSDAFEGQTVGVSSSKGLTITAPFTDVSKIAAATGGTVVLAGTAQSAITYLYIKNTGSLADNSNTATNIVTVADAGGADFAQLGADEFLFVPLDPAEGFKVTSASAAMWVEYAYFTKG